MSRGTPDPGMASSASPTGLLPSLAAASLPLLGCQPGHFMPVLYPGLHRCLPVWALPRSLATTCGITVVFSSCGYLDVSVPRVSLLPDYVFIRRCLLFYFRRVPPLGYLRIYGYLRLPAAFRSLSRPSSAPGAKAFALCSF